MRSPKVMLCDAVTMCCPFKCVVMVFLRDNLKHPKMDSQTAKAFVWIFIFNHLYLWQVMNWVWCDSQKLPCHCFTTMKYVRVDPNWLDTYVWLIYIYGACIYMYVYMCACLSYPNTWWYHHFVKTQCIPTLSLVHSDHCHPQGLWPRLGEDFFQDFCTVKKNHTQNTWLEKTTGKRYNDEKLWCFFKESIWCYVEDL